MSEEKIQSALGLRPLEEAKAEEWTDAEEEAFKDLVDTEKNLELSDQELDLPVPIEENGENLEDITLARENILKIMKHGEAGLDELMILAKQGENLKAFDSANSMMITLMQVNRSLIEISDKKRFAKEEINAPKEAAQNNITNNNLILSTADLLKMIKGEKEIE